MFAAPLFLFGLAAAGIPLLIHLRRSRQGRTIDFSTTRFFDERFMRAARRAQLQERLLMLLRMALLALFALALAQPLIRFPGMGGLGSDKRYVAIIIDDSASMRIPTPQGVLLDQAKNVASTVLAELSEARGDRATVILAGQRGGGAKVLFDEPTTDLEAVRRAIQQIEPTDLAADMNAAAASAVQSLAPEASGSGSAARVVVVISDLQEGSFAPGQISEIGSEVNWLFVPVQPPRELTASNLSVDAVQYGAGRPMRGVPYTFRALITNHGDRLREQAVNLVIDGQQVDQQHVTLPPARSQAVRFVHRFANAGWHTGRIELANLPSEPVDIQTFDDTRHFVLRVTDTTRILAVNGARSQITAEDELFFFRAALEAAQPAQNRPGDRQGKAIVIVQIAPAALTEDILQGYRLVVLANVAALTPPQADSLERYVDNGGSLLITLGDRVDPDNYNQWIGPNRLHGGMLPSRLTQLVQHAERPGAAEYEAEEIDDFIAIADRAHPVLSGFAEGTLGYLSSVRFRTRYDLDAPEDAVLMRSSSGGALLVEKRLGQGRVMLFASTIDKDWTDFPLQPVYVPWVYRLVSYLAQPAADRQGFIRTGQLFRLPSSVMATRPMHVLRPDGKIVYPQPMQPGTQVDDLQAPMAISATELAGVYRVLPPDRENTQMPYLMFAANTPSREARPMYLDEKALRSAVTADAPIAFTEAESAAQQIAQMTRRGYGLWDHLLFAALMVALLEPWFANRLAGRRARRAVDALAKRTIPELPQYQRRSHNAA